MHWPQFIFVGVCVCGGGEGGAICQGLIFGKRLTCPSPGTIILVLNENDKPANSTQTWWPITKCYAMRPLHLNYLFLVHLHWCISTLQ